MRAASAYFVGCRSVTLLGTSALPLLSYDAHVYGTQVHPRRHFPFHPRWKPTILEFAADAVECFTKKENTRQLHCGRFAFRWLYHLVFFEHMRGSSLGCVAVAVPDCWD